MADQIDAAYYNCFMRGAGSTVMDDMRAAYYDRPMFNTAEPNALGLAFREGQRSVVLEIMSAINRGAVNQAELPGSTDPERESEI